MNLINPYIFSNPNSGLVVYYPFNGNANDASENGINGTVSGASLTTDRNEQPNKAYSFSPPSYIRLDSPLLNISSAITLASWVRISNLSAQYQEVISKAESGGYALIYNHVDFAPNKFIGLLFINGAYRVPKSTTTPQLNVWYHVTVTFDGRYSKIYINGTLEDTVDQSGTISITGEPVAIGADPGGLGSYFTNFLWGSIDEVRIYNRALTSLEILDLYNL